MTITQILKLAVAKLSSKKIKFPHLEAEILLSEILKKPREFLLVHGEKKLTTRQISNFNSKISRRLKGEPIAYLTGHKEFYGLDFKVNKNVLVPRPETELMVEEALKLIARNSQRVTLVDIGTGSGCIIITLAKQTADCELIAIDISAKALNIARQNARKHNVHKKIKFIKGNLLKPIINSKFVIRLSPEALAKGGNSKLIIVANLPYGWKEWKNNCSMDSVGLKYEPPVALFTGKNGLALYEKLFKQINILAVGGGALCNINVLCEFDPRQTVKIKQLIKRELPQAKLQIKKDLSGLNRLAIIKF